MGDPGLHSKFVEMQQEQAFAPRTQHLIVNPYVEALRLDRVRILALLSQAKHTNRIKTLKRALKEVERKLDRT